MGRGVFVTGTDTEVGKSVVAAGMLHGLRRGGRRVAGMKPVSAGCRRTPAGLRNDDAELLRRVAGRDFDYAQINPYAFEPPIAPHLAAVEAGVEIELERLQTAYRALAASSDYVVVEGAGGWRVPLGPRLSISDLPAVLRLPVVLVVGVRLGCLNHALLSAAAIRADGLPLIGWIANVLIDAAERPGAQVATLEERLNAPLLGVVPRLSTPAADAAAMHIDIPRIRDILDRGQ